MLVDARNVLRSTWPNIPEAEVVDGTRRWAAAEGVEAIVVFDGRAPEAVESDSYRVVGTGAESADDWIAAEATRLAVAGEAFWIVTSDRELRGRAAGAERAIGGGAFAKTLLAGRADAWPDG